MTTNPPRGISNEELRNRFQYHPPRNDDEVAQHTDVRDELYATAENLNATLPDGREKSLVITHLEEAMFWANAALARARA